MARIGLTNIWYAHLTESAAGVPTYDGAKQLGKAVSCSVEITNNSASLYADDVLAESDTSFASGTVTLGVSDDDDSVFADILGHHTETTAGGGIEVVKASTDVAPYIGMGRIVTKMVNGVYKFKAEFLYKVKFQTPSTEENTKGENVEFGTPEIEGTISALADEQGTWGVAQTFTSKADALEYLQGLMQAPVTYTVTYDVNGGTGSVAAVTVNAGESVQLNTGSSITPPSNKTFAGWATTESAESPNVTSPYTPTGDVTLYAVYTAN